MILDLKPLFADEGAQLAFDYPMDLCGYEVAPGDFPFREPVTVQGRVQNSASVVELDARARFRYFTRCDRCNREIQEEFSVPVRHILARSLQSEENEEFLLVQDDVLDLDKVAVTDMILALPMKHLCREDCKGLCPVCGKNLNDGPCGCKSAGRGNSGFDSLKGFVE